MAGDEKQVRKRNVEKSDSKNGKKTKVSNGTKKEAKEEKPSAFLVWMLVVAVVAVWGTVVVVKLELVDYKGIIARITERGLEPDISYGEPPVAEKLPEEELKKAEEIIPEPKKEAASPAEEKGKVKKVKETIAKSKKKDAITNSEDRKIRKELDAADKLVDDGDYDTALKKFDALLDIFPNSPRALYGRAQAEDKVAEKWKSNEWLQTCIDTYGKVPSQKNCPKELKKQALLRQSDRLSFYGKGREAVKALVRLNELVPRQPDILNKLGVSYLMVGNNKAAKRIFAEVLQIRPEDGFAKVHLGFVLKSETRFDEAIPLLREGISTEEEGTIDGRFFFHLGDALYRQGQPDEAKYWYQNGADRGLFASMYQRSLYNEPNLRAQPFWTPEQGGNNFIRAVQRLEWNWKIIRDEGLKNMDAEKGVFLPEEENLKNTGDWKQFTLYQRGQKQESNCKRAPQTCLVISFIKDATGCSRGQVKFSIMQPGTHVWPHTGPTNCRLRMHLGLVVPKNGTRLRVGDDIKTWEEGKVIIFDDSFEHEVWQEADSYRMILIIDMWHPDLTAQQKKTLTPI